MEHIIKTIAELRAKASHYMAMAAELEIIIRAHAQPTASANGNGHAPEPARAPKKPRQPRSDAAPRRTGGNEVATQLRSIIPSLGDIFSVDDVIAVLDQELTPEQRLSINSAMVYMAKKGELELVEKGRPGSPGKYRRVSQPA